MTESLLGLLIEFDEMGFAPTTVCADPEGFAVRWKEQIVKEIEALKSENAALRERLEKAVELPVNVGDDEVFVIVGETHWMEECKVTSITIKKRAVWVEMRSNDSGIYRVFSLKDHGRLWFTELEAAEARLAELKGESHEQ